MVGLRTCLREVRCLTSRHFISFNSSDSPPHLDLDETH